MSRLTCSIQEFNNAVVLYQKSDELRKQQRLGQYIWNLYGDKKQLWEDFYNEENLNTVIGLGTVEAIMGAPVAAADDDL